MRARLSLLVVLTLLLGAACAAQLAPSTPSTGPATLSPGALVTSSPTASASPTAAASASPSASPSPSLSPTPSPSYDPAALADELSAVLERERTAHRIPGMTVAVIMPDGQTWSGGGGFASLEEDRPAVADTPFVVGSISKTFVATLVVQLAREGALGLDDPLAKWLPDYPAPAGTTLRHLLTHTSGIFNYFEHPAYNRRVFGKPGRVWTPDEIVTEFYAPPYFAPGTAYHYSNTGFVLLGMVVERATGNSLADELRTRFFDRLGLADTFFQGEGPPPGRSAQGYLVGRDGPRLINDGTDYRPTTSAATVAWAAGAVVAGAPDLAAWARKVYGGSLLHPDDLAAMTDFAANPYSLAAYGLGTRTRFVGSHQVIGHSGSLRGFAAAMWHFPAENITLVVLTNRGRIDINPIVDALAAPVLDAAGYGP